MAIYQDGVIRVEKLLQLATKTVCSELFYENVHR